jgi:hypothetical protein
MILFGGCKMGLIFRKRVKLIPGVWLNLSKRGISTSIGGKGLTVNVKGDKVRTTASIPATGISYRSTSTSKHDDSQPAKRSGLGIVLLLLAIGAILLYYSGH